MDNTRKIQIITIADLLSQNLTIPLYQRPYKWTAKNIDELLNDVLLAIDNKKDKNTPHNYKYRVGTVLLHKNPYKYNDRPTYDIVDGQQRIISFNLLALYLFNDSPYPYNEILEETKSGKFITKKFSNKITQKNIHENYSKIKNWFISNSRTNLKRDFINALDNLLEVVVITVDEDKQSEAFQLFDSQNNRGKPLDPHDLLKAFHLREMRNNQDQMENMVDFWEARKPEEIANLFNIYLFPILRWTRNQSAISFSVDEIDTYKGIPDNDLIDTDNQDKLYPYSKRINKAMPEFQISESFIPGEDFFLFVKHYFDLQEELEHKLNNSPLPIIHEMNNIISNIEENQTGLTYAKNLFNCVLLAYYDRFGNLDETVVRKLFVWAFMIRIDMEHLGFDTINKYSLGDQTKGYTNKLPMFNIIYYSRRHTDLTNIEILVTNKSIEENLKIIKNHEKMKWEDLYLSLKKINGDIEN
ncbi:Protein of unknown function DUF262 [Treponema bryantii]|uniref:Uncharacterized protein n=1 Tax=Treponema bryantii TaxID=163 RepID=A0A1I3LLQ9_9SPIR|nr:DUF262 domain-containing protein [Treponema bryantii]SFI85661.1 Protein of unknown function DUF262 [Treponema bryantii]